MRKIILLIGLVFGMAGMAHALPQTVTASSSTAKVTAYLASGTGNDVDATIVNIATITSNGIALPVTSTSTIIHPTTSGGLSVYRSTSVVNTGISVKGSAGQLYGGFVYNANATIRYLHFYDIATAPNVGTTADLFSVAIPPTSTVLLGAFSGITFASGIGIAATTASTPTDSGAPSANDILAVILYK